MLRRTSVVGVGQNRISLILPQLPPCNYSKLSDSALHFLKKKTGYEWNFGYPKRDNNVWQRGDRRSVKEIFANGFMSLGDDKCVINYVFLNSLSTYIGGSTDSSVADWFTFPFGYRYVCDFPKISIEAGNAAIALSVSENSDVSLSKQQIAGIKKEAELAAVDKLDKEDIRVAIPIIFGIFPLPFYAVNSNYKLKEMRVSIQINSVCSHQADSVEKHAREQKKLKPEHRFITHEEAKQIHALLEKDDADDKYVIKDDKNNKLVLMHGHPEVKHEVVVIHSVEKDKTPADIVADMLKMKIELTTKSARFFKSAIEELVKIEPEESLKLALKK